MATQASKGNEQQSQQSQSVTRGSQDQGISSRRGGYGLSFPFSPSDFFRMDPFSLMRRMSHELDQVFSESGVGQSQERTWAPAIEVRQQGENYVVRADLPGLKPEDVKLEVTEDAIVIEGERKSEHEENKGGMHVSERRYGRFYRAIPLPEGARTEDARANFNNGVLEVTIPTPEQKSKRRSIPIQGGAQAEKAGTSKG
jgi:HSP20 family protein